jgi:glucosamine--fructose-6-phosphate aminotransferase (isomerizing)
MCGITGILSSISYASMQMHMIHSLMQLQNRGYDSSGISILQKNNQICLSKKIKTEKKNIFEDIKNETFHIRSAHSIIGHNRWATHGGISTKNAHPHVSASKNIILVHNGIFENYLTWKNFLNQKGYHFQNDTDSEVIANLIDYYTIDLNLNIEEAIMKLHIDVEGTFAIIVQYTKTPTKLYATKKGSPLLIGKNKNMIIATSEKSGFLNLMDKYIVLEPNDICIMELKDEKPLYYTRNIQYPFYNLNNENYQLTPYPFPHWTKKEIFEQPETFFRVINNGGRLSISDLKITLGGICQFRDAILQCKKIILLGCGTSLHSCEYIKRFFKSFRIFPQIESFDGSEFDLDDIGDENENIVSVLVSQSGETSDLYRCLPILKSKKILTIGVINVVDSLIAREVDCGVYCNAGKEVGVASTKAFLAQILVLLLLFLWVAQEKELNTTRTKIMLLDYILLSEQIRDILKQEDEIRKLASDYCQVQSIFLLGKGCDEIISKEGALKIKEITYIHAEAYNASALKHGPFALLDKNVPVLLFCSSSNHREKILNCYYEIKARDAPVIFFSDIELVKDEQTIKIPTNNTFSSLLSVIPVQLFAYYLSLYKNLDPDKPRNLAKVVTVE